MAKFDGVGRLAVGRLAVCFASLAIGTSLVNTAWAEGDSVIQLLTYNIRYANDHDGADVWPARKESVADVIRTADVVGLQEVEVEQLKYLQTAVPGFTWVGVGRDDGKEAGEFSPIGVRSSRFEIVRSGTFWLSETPEQVGSRGWDAALPRIATWILMKDQQTGELCGVINTHFDHRGERARLESGRLIRQRVAEFPDQTPVVVMGDLNAGPDSPPLQAVMADGPRRLSDSRSVTTTPPTGPSGTVNGFKEIREGQRIDHILVTPGVEVQSYQVLDPRTPEGRFASDHLPVWASLQIASD